MAGPDEFGSTVSEKMTFFYAYDGLIDFKIRMWLKWGFDILIVLFGWFGIITNVEKMVCQPGIISRKHSTKAYGLHITNKGDPQCVKQHQRLVCGDCGYMVDHLHMKHVW